MAHNIVHHVLYNITPPFRSGHNDILGIHEIPLYILLHR